MQIVIKNKDTLLYEEFKFKCSIGKNGISSNKVEKLIHRTIIQTGKVPIIKDVCLEQTA